MYIYMWAIHGGMGHGLIAALATVHTLWFSASFYVSYDWMLAVFAMGRWINLRGLGTIPVAALSLLDTS